MIASVLAPGPRLAEVSATTARPGEPALVGVLVLTALALALRWVGVTDALAGDEVSTLYDVHGRSLGGVLELLVEGPRASNEYTPPLYFVLAWAAQAFGGPLELIRLPALLASLAAVPVVYGLGVHVGGARTGLLAAAVWVLAPFSVFYGTEARAYSLLALLSAASTLVLVKALARAPARRRWWVAYALLAAGVAYTHYTGAAMLVAQGAWALAVGTGRRRAVLAANAGALALYAPWLPFVRTEETVLVYGIFGPMGLSGHLKVLAQVFPGHPFASPSELPGVLGLVVLTAIVVGAGGLAARRARRRELRIPALGSAVGLLVVVALASPVGLLVLSVAEGQTVFLPRSLAASVPAAMVLLAALARAPGRQGAVMAVVGLLGVCAAGAALTLLPEHRRPDVRAVARALDVEARPEEPVVQATLSDPLAASSRYLSNYFERPHPERFYGIDEGPAVREAARAGRRVFVLVLTEVGVERLVKPPAGFVEVGRRRVPGFLSYALVTYRPQ